MKYLKEADDVDRPCGECTACCVLPRIQDRPGLTSLPLLPQGKPGYTPCEHLGQSGCSRYEERPKVCSEFGCMWKFGMIVGDERRRPDRLGLMFAVQGEEGNYSIEAWELWERASSDYPGRGILESLQASTGRVLVRYYGVPCAISMKYISLEKGYKLALMAREEPAALAAWIQMTIDTALMQKPDNSADLDISSLAAGIPVIPHFRK